MYNGDVVLKLELASVCQEIRGHGHPEDHLCLPRQRMNMCKGTVCFILEFCQGRLRNNDVLGNTSE